MPIDPQLPLCLSGTYAPFVLACGFSYATARARTLTCAPSGGDLRTLRYRLLRVEHASLRLGRRGPVVSEGGAVLLVPGIQTTLSLAPQARVSHLAFDVVASVRRRKPNGILVAIDAVVQPSPLATWGMTLPEIVPTPLLPRLHAMWPIIKDRYWRSLSGQLESNLLLAGFLLALLPQRDDSTDRAGGTVADHADPIIRAVEFGMRAARQTDPLRCRDLARTAGLSPAQFRRRFTAQEGISPGRWLLARRLDEAAARLLRGLPAQEAGLNSGWNSPATFSHAFARRFGSPPGAWQRKMLGRSRS